MNLVSEIPRSVSRVVMRVDYNLPLTSSGSVGDLLRIQRTKKTIKYCLDQGKKVCLLSHWGRPVGYESQWSLCHIHKQVQEVLGIPVDFDATPLTDHYTPTDAPITLCENVRFYAGELSNDDVFVQSLMQRGEVFVNEAFSVSHRQHASVYGIAQRLDSYVGFSCQKDWDNILSMREKMHRAIAFVGGCKIETKLPLICKLLPVVQKMALGALLGVAMRDFLLKGHGDSVLQEYAQITKLYTHKIVFPLDVRTHEGSQCFDSVQTAERIIDVGPLTEELYKSEILRSFVLFMNGPVGQYEVVSGAKGTRAIGKAVFSAAQSSPEFFALLGGGDTAAALMEQYEWPSNVIFSTSGGALLYAMTCGELPGLKAIEGFCG